jgi:hypothetical protein
LAFSIFELKQQQHFFLIQFQKALAPFFNDSLVSIRFVSLLNLKEATNTTTKMSKTIAIMLYQRLYQPVLMLNINERFMISLETPLSSFKIIGTIIVGLFCLSESYCK